MTPKLRKKFIAFGKALDHFPEDFVVCGGVHYPFVRQDFEDLARELEKKKS